MFPIFLQIGVKNINNKFDKEYSTMWPLECLHLKQCGIPYTFVKVVDGKTIWKYEKNENLFLALAKFYRLNKEI